MFRFVCLASGFYFIPNSTMSSLLSYSVVKLFNAVSKHQKEMECKLSSAPTEAKKSKGKDPNLVQRLYA